jgi:hypothetical protein
MRDRTDTPVLEPQAEQDDADRALRGARALELVVELAHDLRSPVAAILEEASRVDPERGIVPHHDGL